MTLPRVVPLLAILTLALACSGQAPPAPAPDGAPTPPALQEQEQHGVHLAVPEGWKLLVKRDVDHATMSSGLATTLTLYWYPYKQGVTGDLMLDVLLQSVRKQLPIGEIRELGREPLVTGFEGEPWMPRRGELLHAEVEVGVLGLRYVMKLGFAALVDEPNHRVVAAVLLTPVERWHEVGALELVAEVARSLARDDDPLGPSPGWWWGAGPPKALAALPPADGAPVP